jgi:nitroreductase
MEMLFDEVILGRRSIRGYKPDPVPKELIKEIIYLALRAPSSMNTQPCNFYVVTGEALDRIRCGNGTVNITKNWLNLVSRPRNGDTKPRL